MAELLLNTHPFYDDYIDEWEKYRLVFNGGASFVNRFLYKFSDAEDDADFEKRKKVTYRPNHAKRAILKIRDAVFQRMVDVKRDGGPPSYISTVAGKDGGVNKRGMSIGAYIGLTILPELLSMGRAFIFVDKQPITPSYNGKVSVADAFGKTPYLSLFRTEDVLSWTFGEPNSKHEYTSVMLRERCFKTDAKTNMPCGQTIQYRKLWVENDKVYAQYYDDKWIADVEIIPLAISRIPLVRFEITESLMCDIADYQIALLNLVSADMQYLLNANTGVYVEQMDPKWEAQYVRQSNPNEVASSDVKDANGNVIVPQGSPTQTGTQAQAERAVSPKIKLGYKYARRYTTQNAPEFISPSTDPVVASMKKQDQLIADIERLVNLKVENLSITGEAKKQDRSGLESGLSTIGLVLQTGENQLADFWAEYEGSLTAIVTYPSDYSLKTDGDRIEDANELTKLKTAVPSPTFSREVSKKIAHTMFDSKVDPEVLIKMDNEIDNAEYTTSDPDTLATAHQEGAIDAVMMARALGFKNPEKLAASAQKEQAERLATIAIHQQAAAGARGVSDMKQSSADGKKEKLLAKQKPKTDQKTAKE